MEIVEFPLFEFNVLSNNNLEYPLKMLSRAVSRGVRGVPSMATALRTSQMARSRFPCCSKFE